MTAGHDSNRILVVLPSWVGDAVMATPALRRLRTARPGAFIGALARPGLDTLLRGLTDQQGREVFDEFHVARPTGVLGPKHVAAKLRPRRYDTSLLLTGSFSTALVARIAGIPERIGYDRDGRGFLLTRRLHPPKQGKAWAIVPAVSYYWHAVTNLLDPSTDPSLAAPTLTSQVHAETILPPDARLALPITQADEDTAAAVRTSAGLAASTPTAILNPGGNNPAKRWPADRYAALADHLADAHGLTVLLNGSPAEADLCRDIAARARANPVILSDHGHTLGSLKVICRDARIMVTNDTGPRHIAAAMGTPVVTLFGPTDARWTTIPVAHAPDGTPLETVLVADPTLAPAESANDHPERCRVDRISLEQVCNAADVLLAAAQRPQA